MSRCPPTTCRGRRGSYRKRNQPEEAVVNLGEGLEDVVVVVGRSSGGVKEAIEEALDPNAG